MNPFCLHFAQETRLKNILEYIKSIEEISRRQIEQVV